MDSETTAPRVAFLLLVLAAGSLAALGPHREMLHLALWVWGGAWILLLYLWWRGGSLLDRGGVVLGGAILLRLLFLPTLPDLSDDLFRYVWDGWLSWQGISPYAHRPSDPALAHLQDSLLFQEMNSPDFHSIYPPLSQLVFLLGGGVHAWMGWPASGHAVVLGFLTLETAGLLFLLRTMGRAGIPQRHAILYAWNPLVLLVVAGGGHSEAGLVLGLAILLAGVQGRLPSATWTGWALSVLSKGFPLILLPLVWRAIRRTHSRREALRGSLLPGVGALLLTTIFLRPDHILQVAGSARLYVQTFEFNAGLYFVLREGARLLTADPYPPFVGPALAVGFLLAGTLVALRHRVDGTAALAGGILWIHSLYLLSATTVHPWYLLWVLPLVPFTPVLRSAWLWASAAALPTYLTYTGTSHLLLASLFWGGWFLLALHGERELLLRPLRRLAAARKARWVRPFLQGRFVDVGGAEGALAGSLRGMGLSPLIVEPSPGRPPENQIPCIRGSGEALPLADGSVDSVLLSFVLHHTRDPDRVLREALRVAGQRVVILESTHEGKVEGWLLERLDRWVNARRGGGTPSPGGGDDPMIVAYRSRGEWLRAIESAGGRVLVADRPNRIGHRVLRLVVEPGQTGRPN